MSDKDFFEKHGLEVGQGSVADLALGEVYPLYGCITKIVNDDLSAGPVEVELNYYINLVMNITDPDKVEIIKKRAFEPGIFVTRITEKINSDGLTSTRYEEDTETTSIQEAEDGFTLAGVCQTVVYGRPTHSGVM